MCKKNLQTKVANLRKEVESEVLLCKQTEKSVVTYKGISRTFWERYCLRERKQYKSLIKVLWVQFLILYYMNWPIYVKRSGKPKEARGCFGIVRLQEYWGMKVAVKELLPGTFVSDVKKEASILASSLCSLSLWSLDEKNAFMYCNAVPYSMWSWSINSWKGIAWCSSGWNWINHVMCTAYESVTLLAWRSRYFAQWYKGWQLDYHSVVRNDASQYQIVLVDFGKATKITESRRYELSAHDKGEFFFINVPIFRQKLLKVTDGLTKVVIFMLLAN